MLRSRIRSLKLVDFAERNNPETRVAWEAAKGRGAALHIAQSELYPALAAVAPLTSVPPGRVWFRQQFCASDGRSVWTGVAVGLHHVRLWGARGPHRDGPSGARCRQFVFNDTHRKIIFQVADTYYRLLNAVGQVEADEASLLNAKTVQEAAENRLEHGLATLPDVLEARSATAQAEYDLQSARGVRGNCSWRPGDDAWDLADRQHPSATTRRTAGSRDAR